jgi:hypothetical protein
MVKFNLEYHEPVSELILGTLVHIIDIIEKSPEENSNKIILDYLKKYYDKRDPINHRFSNDIIEFVKNDIILRILEVNKESIKEINQPVKDKLITFFIDIFIDDFFNCKFIELSDDD